MAKKLKQLLVLSALGFFITACQQEIDPNMLTTPGSGGSPGGGTTSNSYFPLTPGSWWRYRDSASGQPMTMTATPLTRAFENILFTKMAATGNTNVDTSYMASPQPDYYMRTQVGSPVPGSSLDLIIHYLNDTASVGHHWTYQAGHGNGFTAHITTTIVARNLTKTVAGKTYSQVIQTRMDLNFDMMGFQVPVGYYNVYVAKGVGIIRLELHTISTTQGSIINELVDHHIE